MHRGLNAFIYFHSVGSFKRLFKTDGVGTLSDQPALLFSNILAKKIRRLDSSEFKWEQMLDEHLGDFYLPLYKRAKSRGGGRLGIWYLYDCVGSDGAILSATEIVI